MKVLLLALWLAAMAAAEVCGAGDLAGAYGFRHAGVATISNDSEPRPFASVGRLVFGSDGHATGTSSVHFGGVFLGNPTTGNYEFKTDCSFTFELQDDSGGWQHFRGKLKPGGEGGTYTQSDSGVDGRGEMTKTPESCGNAAFQGEYAVAIGSQHTVTSADGSGNLAWSSGEVRNTGSYQVDADCFVELDFGVHLRGVLVNGGKTVLAVQTDPGKAGSATFTAR